MLRRPSPVVLSALALVIALSAGSVVLARQDQQRMRDRQTAIDTRREIEDLRRELSRLDNARVSAGENVDLKRARLEALNYREARVLADLGRDRHRMALCMG